MPDQNEPGVIFPEHVQPMFEANALLATPEALAPRLQSDGYLFFRRLIPAATLANLRAEITAILDDLGWILVVKQRDQAKAIVMPQREGEPGYFQALDRIVRLEALHSLAHEQNLLRVMRQVLGESAFPHPLSITRLVFPNHPEITTPPHQDYRNNQGTVNLTAAWIPLGDCAMSDG